MKISMKKGKVSWVSWVLVVLLVSFGSTAVGAEAPSEEHPYGYYPGVTLTVVVLSGGHSAPWVETAEDFHNLTAVKIEVVEFPFSGIYEKEMAECVSHSGAFDVMEVCNMWVPDFKSGGFIMCLDEYIEKWNPNLEDVAPAVRKLMKLGGKYWSLLLDGDVFMLHYRKDLFENPTYKSEFKARYGYELNLPKTWDEYRDMAEFFTRDTNGDGQIDLWGDTLMLSRVHLPFTFVQLLKSYGVPYFDPDTMEPQINSPRAIEALKMLKELLKYMPLGNRSWGYTEVRDAWVRGDVALMVQWNELCYELYKDSRVKNITGYTLVPGTMINGKLHQASLQAWGWTAVISADSRNKEAAYQYLRYVTSPEIMTNVFHRGTFGYEPWRESEFTNPRLLGFTPASSRWLKAVGENMAIGVPDLHIPGGFEYYDSLAIHVGEALTGKISPKAALDAAAKDWNKTTKARGKKAQLKAYRELLGMPVE